MTGRAKRLTSIVGVVALLAGVAGAILATEPAAAAKKVTDPNAFAITTEEPVYMDGSTGLGEFTATGAIKDAGSALSGTDPDLCGLTYNPGWTDEMLCLNPSTNPPSNLVDNANEPPSPIHDLNDDDAGATYFGAGPDIGAREAGTTRSYGGYSSTCP